MRRASVAGAVNALPLGCRLRNRQVHQEASGEERRGHHQDSSADPENVDDRGPSSHRVASARCTGRAVLLDSDNVNWYWFNAFGTVFIPPGANLLRAPLSRLTGLSGDDWRTPTPVQPGCLPVLISFRGKESIATLTGRVSLSWCRCKGQLHHLGIPLAFQASVFFTSGFAVGSL